MIAFAYAGRYLLEVIDVSLDSLKIAGGIILMFLAIDILLKKEKEEEKKESKKRWMSKILTKLLSFQLQFPLLLVLQH